MSSGAFKSIRRVILSPIFEKTQLEGTFNKAILSLQEDGLRTPRAFVSVSYAFKKIRVCLPSS